MKVKGEDVPIKTVTLEDTTAKAKVTLLRDVSSTEVHPGDYIMIKDVVINSYRNGGAAFTVTKMFYKIHAIYNSNTNKDVEYFLTHSSNHISLRLNALVLLNIYKYKWLIV